MLVASPGNATFASLPRTVSRRTTVYVAPALQFGVVVEKSVPSAFVKVNRSPWIWEYWSSSTGTVKDPALLAWAALSFQDIAPSSPNGPYAETTTWVAPAGKVMPERPVKSKFVQKSVDPLSPSGWSVIVTVLGETVELPCVAERVTVCGALGSTTVMVPG